MKRPILALIALALLALTTPIPARADGGGGCVFTGGGWACQGTFPPELGIPGAPDQGVTPTVAPMNDPPTTEAVAPDTEPARATPEPTTTEPEATVPPSTDPAPTEPAIPTEDAPTTTEPPVATDQPAVDRPAPAPSVRERVTGPAALPATGRI